MSFDVNKYREDHESEDQWQLRRAFLFKWKDHYPQERLLCLARVFINIEFMGCRYPTEVMHEVARLSADIAKNYKNNRINKLKRTFVSASVAAGDRVRGVKREGGRVVESLPKNSKIAFVPQGLDDTTENNNFSISKEDEIYADTLLLQCTKETESPMYAKDEFKSHTLTDKTQNQPTFDVQETNGPPNFKGINYFQDLTNIDCLDVRDFNERMFKTEFGQFVLVIRPWNDMMTNLLSSCTVCNVRLKREYRNGTFTVMMNHQTLACIKGGKITSKARAGRIVWEKLRGSAIVLFVKEQWIAQNDSLISMNDMAGKKHEFGEPIEDSVALNMMKLMGWKGGGLGANSQGIAEPIKPNLRMVSRAGLGLDTGLDQLKRAGLALMRSRGIGLDADLVFASDFTADERGVLHKCASQCGLQSKSYGRGLDRFLVVTNKLKPFALVRALIERGGETAKYRVFISANIGRRGVSETGG